MVNVFDMRRDRPMLLTFLRIENSDRPAATKSVTVEEARIDIGVAAYDALQVIHDFTIFTFFST